MKLYALNFFLHPSGAHRHLHSFPTRRSSDLASRDFRCGRNGKDWCVGIQAVRGEADRKVGDPNESRQSCASSRNSGGSRSEEHTSELQSRFDLVCRLLLEKKKNKTLRIDI